jgi:hypothetical protein
MAANLPGLPAELLAMIVASEPDPSHLPGTPPDDEPASVDEHTSRICLFNTLRATCAGMNAKLVNEVGPRYINTISMTITEADVAKLHNMTKGSFRLYPCNLILNVDSILEEQRHEQFVLDYRIVQSVVDFIAWGSFSRTVRAVLPKFPKLRSIQIISPLLLNELAEDKRFKIERCWRKVVRKLLTVSLTALPTLEEFSIPDDDSERLPVPISVFEILDGFRPKCSPCLKRLQLYLVADLAEGRFQLSFCSGLRLTFVYRIFS